ncbi:hypothetical protein FQA39_LY12002 [Lamprigera yunnana]|nr:hypothetical protein FQA39_LY12002 [Lamprigera yunnana]
MSINSVTAMDVDSPAGILKRCSSAPTINDTNSTMTTSASTNSAREQPVPNLFSNVSQPRTRRFSGSFSPSSGSMNSGLRLTPRISQLRQEEWADSSNLRELAHEREIHHTMQISQSWEDLRFTESPSDTKSGKMGPLHVSLPSCVGILCNSPSPTRINSPGFQSPTRNRTFVRRSCSPVLRPSPLGVKRKLDDDKLDYHFSPRAKRFYSFGASDRGGLLTTTSSPIPGSLSSIGTPESLSSADSPSFNFRLIDSPSPSRPQLAESMVVSKTDQDMAESPS